MSSLTPVDDSPILPGPLSWRIGYAEIAALAQVKRPVPTTWSRRHSDFPAPVTRESGSPLFDAREVVDWLVRTGRGNAEPRRLRAEAALHTLSAWRSSGLSAPVLVGALTALICLRQQYDTPIGEHTWGDLLAQATDLDTEDTFLLSELRALPDPERLGPALGALADELTEAAYTPAEAFDWVLEARRRLGSHDLAADEPTPAVARALAALAGIDSLPDESVLATPDARSGDLLAALHAAAAEDAGHTYLAAEPDPALARLVRRRMLVRGVYEFSLDVTEGETLSTEDWGDPDVLVCALPYEAGETRSAREVLERVQDLTDYLSDGSTAVVLGPADALVRPLPRHGDADRLRRSFLDKGLLKVAISLPDGAFAYRPGYRTAVWILTRTPKDERAGRVLLADYSAQPLTEPVLDVLAEDITIWRASGWRGDRRHELRHAAVVLAKDLDDRPGSAFTPQHRSPEARYTRVVMERPARIADVERHLAELDERVARRADGSVKTGAVLRPEDQQVRRTTVRRLLKDRRLRRRPGHRIAPEHLSFGGHYSVIGPEEILGASRFGSRRIDRGLILTAYEHVQFTEPGDLVVTTSPRFGVHVDTEGLSVVITPARILRVHPDADPPVRSRALAALLRAAACDHGRTSGAVRASWAIEDLSIPDLGREELERYEAVLAEIERRAELLRQLSEALDDLTNITAAGMTDGTLTIQNFPETAS
ncbi:SAM-dependent DNA methyltransferase [Streptomyces sp. sk226]|uniref:SAM-dependent DNA methyltransferase n=1 Tax=Streptomyces sp. sk226 TaxID=2034268 RepID=UPI000BF12FD4|nr:SAM-dependent DNA methyltransferase [Streptomyces sp. sk226]